MAKMARGPAFKTPEAILSFPNLSRPRVAEAGKKPKFGACLVFEDGTDLREMKAAWHLVGEEQFGDKWALMVRSGKTRDPFRSSDLEEKKEYPEGSIFVNTSAIQAPGLVSRYADPKTGKPRAIVGDDIEAEFYPGARVRALVNAYAYDVEGNRGVTFGLNGLQKLGEGDRIDGRTAVTDAFDGEVQDTADMDEDPLAEAPPPPRPPTPRRKKTLQETL